MPLSLTVKTAERANLHGFSRLVAESHGEHSWLRFYTKDFRGKETPELCVHVPQRLAEMIEEAFHAYEDWESGQEGSTFDDALAAKCDADALLKAEEALEFYGDKDLDGYDVGVTNYGLSTEVGKIIKDGGERARATLTEIRKLTGAK